ncbi:MAG TPA: ArsR family transcriptional regulator, partial [Candidatus Paceibacterota bacterium]
PWRPSGRAVAPAETPPLAIGTTTVAAAWVVGGTTPTAAGGSNHRESSWAIWLSRSPPFIIYTTALRSPIATMASNLVFDNLVARKARHIRTNMSFALFTKQTSSCYGVFMNNLERILKALANKRRLAILRFLIKQREAMVGEIAEAISLSFRSTSRHLAILFASDILEKEQRRLEMWYHIKRPQQQIVAVLLRLL